MEQLNSIKAGNGDNKIKATPGREQKGGFQTISKESVGMDNVVDMTTKRKMSSRAQECMGAENGWFVFSMGDDCRFPDELDHVLMVKLDGDGEPYVDYFKNGQLWGIHDDAKLQYVVQAIYTDYLREFFPHAAAAQRRLDNGEDFQRQPVRMVAIGDASGVTAVDDDWYDDLIQQHVDYWLTVDEASYRGQ